MVKHLINEKSVIFFLFKEFYSGLSDDWRSQIDECLQMLLGDRDRDVCASVGGVYQARGTALPSEHFNNDSDSSTLNYTITLGDQS
jgi:hypothetical protein